MILILGLSIFTSCSTAVTSRDNAKYLSEFDDVVDYDDPPVLVDAIRPEYPPMARAMGAEGRAVLKVLVLGDGSVGGIQILESRNPILTDQAITAVRKSSFAPARKDGKPVNATMVIPFVFTRTDAFLR